MTSTITRKEWQSMQHHGYASISKGQRYILAYEKATGATVLEPVEVVGLPRPAATSSGEPA